MKIKVYNIFRNIGSDNGGIILACKRITKEKLVQGCVLIVNESISIPIFHFEENERYNDINLFIDEFNRYSEDLSYNNIVQKEFFILNSDNSNL
ncbi:hypothetical protein FIA58_003435 [Flavobacterium jejuense]|uniref:Uncharacterized protein n=1 Tax=Flavobacterium jejuense TaxID=1544455 RepID=A0ABX0ILM0_9FLAO|nr:hypothetical protein [Flavobacterium jejuense]NHN24719.1 hypothetical protein [Flavobacterium jejuense]